MTKNQKTANKAYMHIVTVNHDLLRIHPMLLSLFFLFFTACSKLTDAAKPTTAHQEAALIPDLIDFNFDVKPILSDRCFKCHGPDERKMEGGFQLHIKERAFAALGDSSNRFAVIPYDTQNSILLERIYAKNPEDVMPPPESNLQLSDTEKAILKRWVEQGAPWKKHWAFVPPINPENACRKEVICAKKGRVYNGAAST